MELTVVANKMTPMVEPVADPTTSFIEWFKGAGGLEGSLGPRLFVRRRRPDPVVVDFIPAHKAQRLSLELIRKCGSFPFVH